MTLKSLRPIILVLAIGLGLSASALDSGAACRSVFASTQPLARVATPPQVRAHALTNLHTIQQIHTYLGDTVNSLEQMRGANGLLSDTIWIQSDRTGKIQIQNINRDTSPTNIAVDLLVQTELRSRPEYQKRALQNIEHVISTLEKIKYHHETGLIFSRYAADATSAVKDANVSAIDNLHLALTLWTLSHEFAGTRLGARAKRLFERMDFSVYYDQDTGLLGGNLRPQNGRWVREAYEFANLGSEARLVYSVGWALGLFKKVLPTAAFLPKAMTAMKAEVLHSSDGDILKLWDGAAFQMYFPKMFINEELYSETIQGMYRALANHMVTEGKNRNLGVPAAHSAGRAPIDARGETPSETTYKDKAGNRDLVSSDNQDVTNPVLEKNWDSTFAPNALFMAATTDPSQFLPLFEGMMRFKSGDDSLYVHGLGWMDGYQVEGKLKGQVIPAQLALDQGMIALSLLQMEASDGLSISSRALHADAAVSARLKNFYQLFEEKVRP